MITEREIKGNIFIFCLFQISNICLCVLGFFTFAISIYLMVLSKSIDWINIIFFLLGIILIILSYFGFKLRTAPIGNFFYSVILTAIFICDMILTIIVFAGGEEVIDTIMEKYDTSETTKSQIKKTIEKNVQVASDLLLIVLLILVIF